jgi:hypothetical protein
MAVSSKSIRISQAILLLALFAGHNLFAQDLEPRRWTPLPDGSNVLALGYARAEGDIFFDPVMNIEDATVEADALLLSYVRSFKLGDRHLRFDAVLPWQSKHWQGLLNGEPAEVTRTGLADPLLRLSVNLLDTSSAPNTRTVVGGGLALSLPLGEYKQDRLLNLGQNRFSLRPQIGVLHTRGPWSFEVTGSVFLYSDNDEFFNGNRREQDPLYALQTHLVYVFRPGLWAAVGMAYGAGGESSVNGDSKNDSARQFLSGISVGVPINKRLGMKLGYVRSRSNINVGGDVDSLALALTAFY